MIETSERKFQINPNQYQVFRFSISWPTTLYIRMIATAPVDLLLLDNEERAEYESGREFSPAVTWGRRSNLEESVNNVEPGTWYLIVEGRAEPSKGRILVYQ